MPRRNDIAKILVILAGAAFGLAGFAQTVCVGSASECREQQRRLCLDEKAEPNLSLSVPGSLEGVIRDQSGAVLSDEFFVVVRNANGVELAETQLHEGKFEFSDLKQGKFRLIIVRLEAGAKVRPYLFDQPAAFSCGGSNICKLDLVLKVHGTDNPVDFCPPNRKRYRCHAGMTLRRFW
jgi:hypothetical protein